MRFLLFYGGFYIFLCCFQIFHPFVHPITTTQNRKKRMPLKASALSVLLLIQTVDIRLHTLRTLVTHSVIDVAVYIQRERCGSMSKIGLHGLNIIAILQRDDCKRMSKS